MYLIILLSFINGQSISNSQLDQLKEQFKSEMKAEQAPISSDSESINVDLKPVTIPTLGNQQQEDDEYFGYNYFEREINFFDNIPTSQKYKLGPGDEIIISMWGETNSRTSFTINKDGLIYYENVGFINISNLYISEAEELLKDQLSDIFSTLKDEDASTNLRVELEKLKSVNVYFSGEIKNPGIHLIHPFSDIFTAIVQAGGVNQTGSLRNVHLIRDKKIISTVDFYSFFNTGVKSFSSYKLIDGDIIHVPFVQKRVRIDGQVFRPKFYEILDLESLSDLIEYSGGLTAEASNKAIIQDIIPIDGRFSDDNSKFGRIVKISEANNIFFNNGAKIYIKEIASNEVNVNIYGRVISPGSYPAYSIALNDKNQQIKKAFNLKQILNTAGGFDDPLYRKTIRDDQIVVIRKDEKQFYGLEFKIHYN